jgi:hypothetical protein
LFKLTAIRLDKHEQWLKIEIIEKIEKSATETLNF